MQKLFLTPAVLGCALLLATCSSNPPASNSRGNANAPAQPASSGGANTSGVGVVSSHSGGGSSTSTSAAADSGSDRSLVDTAEQDALIKKAAEKAKAANASAADKKAAADAYLARGNVYYNAGQPRLYKYALADFRQVLKYDPENSEAKEKAGTIESIYKSMGRPIPEVGPEP